MTDFRAFGKIARLNREVIVTEKIDGTNAQICIVRADQAVSESAIAGVRTAMVEHDGVLYDIFAGSRTRWIVPGDDNFAFAKWVHENANELVKLGEGHHFGEWWGQGIQRKYGLDHRRFSLFNVHRWADDAVRPACCHVVPEIARGVGVDHCAESALNRLRAVGSFAAPGFMNPEGVVAFHTASNGLFKVTLEKDDEPKGKSK